MDNRVVPFTTRHLKIYKLLSILTAIGIFGIVVFIWINGNTDLVNRIMISSWAFLLLRYLITQLSIKHISYNDSSFFIQLHDYELQIGFEEVQSIEIISLTGVYRINLYLDSMIGKQIYFKPSLLYPLDYNKVDNQVEWLRFRIERFKRRYNPDLANQLSSFNLKN